MHLKLLLTFCWSRRLLLLVSALVFSTCFAFAQEQTVTGKVTSGEDQQGLPGANVLIKGSATGTVTDAGGMYSIQVPSGEATLVFSSIGYSTTEVLVGGRTTIDVVMTLDVTQLSEVVVVGYGTQEKRDVTAAISSIGSEQIDKIPSTNTMDGMKGQVAGVDILQNGGRPGEYPSITVRGRRSINASNDPLFVVDGVPMTGGHGDRLETTDNDPDSGAGTIYDFNPQDIESIEVLKDAAATAIYGSRGANGVILITTKRGKSGKTTVNYSGYYGVSQPFRTIPMMSGPQFAALKREANRISPLGASGRTAWEGTIPPDDQVFPDPVELNSAGNGTSTDWQDLIYHNGSQMNHQISVAGGNDKTQFNISLGYFDEDGIVDGMDFRKVTSRINVDHTINNTFKVGTSTLFSTSKQNWGSGSVVSEAVNQTPLGLPYDAEGEIIFLPISDGIRSNPLSELVPGKRVDERKFDRIFSSIYAEANITKDLKYKFLIGPDIRYRTRGVFEGQFTNPRKNGSPAAINENEINFGYTLENLLTYSKTLNERHRIVVTFLQSIQKQEYERHLTSVEGLPYETQLWYNVATAGANIREIQSRFEEWALASFMGRINYSFNGKYLLQATLRSDGSSRLAPGNKWTNFPGVSVGWRIIDEPFMAGVGFLNELKLRGSYGVVGNTSVDPYQTPGRLQGPTQYSWNEDAALGFGLAEIPNPEKGWEKSATIDVGVDFGMFNGRLSGTLDFYKTETTDLLLNRALPVTSGYDEIQQNVGATETRGVELTLSANIIDSPGGFRWDADLNLASYSEEIVDLAQRDADGNKVDDTGNEWFIGYPIRVFYDYRKIGIWQASEFDQAQSFMQAYPGEIKLADSNGDGVFSPDDRVILGDDIPSAFGGFNNRFSFKGFDLSVLLYYRLGFMIESTFHDDQATMQGRYNNLNVDYWTIDNPSNDYPRPNKNQEHPQFDTSLRFKDGGYVKLRNITLGYNFPSSITEKLGMSNLRIYFTAQNPVVWSNYKAFDPENAGSVSSGDLPSNKLFLGGINVAF
jgi:TonB-linked SusC/RagA family outer membrane protein